MELDFLIQYCKTCMCETFTLRKIGFILYKKSTKIKFMLESLMTEENSYVYQKKHQTMKGVIKYDMATDTLHRET